MANAQSEQGPLRIVFFGLPEAGKSSLLGALVQVAQHQEPQLGGRVNDLAHGLGQLHKGVYERGPAPTNEEIVAAIDPIEDAQTSAQYRHEVAGAMVYRALTQACAPDRRSRA